MSILEQQEPQLPGQVSGWVAGASVLALALLLGGAALWNKGEAKAAAPAGTFQASCWTLSHPLKLKKADKLGLELDVVAQSYVACVVLNTSTGDVVKEFTPTIPGAR